MELEGSVILITGGTGSLGKALVPELLKRNPHSLRLLSNNEDEVYSLIESFKDIRLRPLIGDVRDKDRMQLAMDGVDYTIHAAALKHVHLCEYNPIEAVKTNIMGSVNVVECALANRVKKVLAISTDKAVEPISIYGATKLAMEKLFVHAKAYGKTKFSCVRFGNFIGSRGSFLQKVNEYSEAGKPIPITDENMSRYWITLEEAARFTIQCLGIMEGQEIFIPKMVEKDVMSFIKDLPYKVVGIRPGEKVREALFTESENAMDLGDLYVVKEMGC